MNPEAFCLPRGAIKGDADNRRILGSLGRPVIAERFFLFSPSGVWYPAFFFLLLFPSPSPPARPTFSGQPYSCARTKRAVTSMDQKKLIEPNTATSLADAVLSKADCAVRIVRGTGSRWFAASTRTAHPRKSWLHRRDRHGRQSLAGNSGVLWQAQRVTEGMELRR